MIKLQAHARKTFAFVWFTRIQNIMYERRTAPSCNVCVQQHKHGKCLPLCRTIHPYFVDFFRDLVHVLIICSRCSYRDKINSTKHSHIVRLQFMTKSYSIFSYICHYQGKTEGQRERESEEQKNCRAINSRGLLHKVIHMDRRRNQPQKTSSFDRNIVFSGCYVLQLSTIIGNRRLSVQYMVNSARFIAADNFALFSSQELLFSRT